MPFDIASLGQQAASTGLGAIMGLALEKHNDQRQIDQERKLQNLQLQGSKDLTDYQFQKQLQMWKDTNYSAQMEQLAKAGLNPGLLYGMSGGGATTTGGDAAKVDTGRAQQNPGEVQQLAGMGMQLGMNQAQIELIKAQTQNVQADTANKTGVIPENIKSQTALNLANTGNAQADTELKKAETQITNFKNKINTATTEEQIMKITMDTALTTEEVSQALIKTGIDRATQYDKIDQVHQTLLNTAAERALIIATTGKTQEETALITKQVQTFIDKLESDMGYQSRLGVAALQNSNASEVQNQIQRDRLEWEKDMKDVPESTKMVVDVVEKILQAIIVKSALKPPIGTTPPPIRGFRNK